MKKKINYVIGDATKPEPFDGERMILHVCNDIGGWGRGFVLALSGRDKTPETAYRKWAKDKIADGVEFKLGSVQLIPYAEEKLYVANMIGQHGIYEDEDGNPPVRYEAIRDALRRVRTVSLNSGQT